MAFLATLVKPGRGLITRATALSINLLFNAVQNSDLRPQAPGNDIANQACNLQPATCNQIAHKALAGDRPHPGAFYDQRLSPRFP